LTGESLGGGHKNFPLPFIPSHQGRGGFFVGYFSNKRGDLQLKDRPGSLM
jgi:hypothetical protein